jgi:hypothetical protein
MMRAEAVNKRDGRSLTRKDSDRKDDLKGQASEKIAEKMAEAKKGTERGRTGTD